MGKLGGHLVVFSLPYPRVSAAPVTPDVDRPSTSRHGFRLPGDVREPEVGVLSGRLEGRYSAPIDGSEGGRWLAPGLPGSDVLSDDVAVVGGSQARAMPSRCESRCGVAAAVPAEHELVSGRWARRSLLDENTDGSTSAHAAPTTRCRNNRSSHQTRNEGQMSGAELDMRILPCGLHLARLWPGLLRCGKGGLIDYHCSGSTMARRSLCSRSQALLPSPSSLQGPDRGLNQVRGKWLRCMIVAVTDDLLASYAIEYPVGLAPSPQAGVHSAFW